jgi:ribosomal protein L11 methylase PrmA
VIANLTAQLLEACARHLATGAQRPEALVCSGMLTSEADGVAAAFAEAGLVPAERRAEGDWAALLLRAEPGATGP